ncbi:hypothetical protein Z947_1251 [Sulfitobacter geojensis]|nr:hypothetical protein Z947_1251 [Sulfitobacter geojensis]
MKTPCCDGCIIQFAPAVLIGARAAFLLHVCSGTTLRATQRAQAG